MQLGVCGMEIFARLALDEHGVRLDFQDRLLASTLAWQRCLIAVTKAVSLVSRSFHQPYWAENLAATKISFTGV